ncbi:hypothetical protein [Dyadobacter psychrotolerans]|uniref:Uncharacterized protein n=1 Tax=Dyadobacter psychrotolerans TaxID=2541721 RepID=A0A4R5DNR9_9BACT|nr:hypothetical protein [Dyadobacter psychrotolerans]TDE13760.1 hypothetical protein E0F88_17835 [Dyadobacter psychrotolerans]
MENVKYRLYPTLLNLFDRYQKGKLSGEEFINRINRVPVPQTEAQARGASFEEAVIKGTNEELYDPLILQKVRSLLPRPMMKTQVYCEYQFDDVLFYGYVDVIGKTLAVDIKTTSQYVPDCFAHSHQNFYLPALKSRGIRSLRYVITNFIDVYQEDYDQSVDFSFQEKQIKSFCEFLEEHRGRITDKRVFNQIL